MEELKKFLSRDSQVTGIECLVYYNVVEVCPSENEVVLFAKSREEKEIFSKINSASVSMATWNAHNNNPTVVLITAQCYFWKERISDIFPISGQQAVGLTHSQLLRYLLVSNSFTKPYLTLDDCKVLAKMLVAALKKIHLLSATTCDFYREILNLIKIQIRLMRSKFRQNIVKILQLFTLPNRLYIYPIDDEAFAVLHPLCFS